MRLRDFKKEEIEKVCKESSSLKELCDKLGYKYHGQNTETIKEYLIVNNIDYSHFENFDTLKIPKIGIYKITNLCNGKVYIGQSQNILRRFRRHKEESCRETSKSYDLPLYRAMRKYGIENFNFEILEECSKGKLDDREKFWIKRYNSTNRDKGYNIEKGGNASGHPMALTLEQVQKIKHLLKTTNLNNTAIAKQLGVGRVSVGDINLGKTWVDEGECYPIRVITPKIYYCIDCGEPVLTKGAKRCLKCYEKYIRPSNEFHKVQSTGKIVSREELKQLIRSTPFTTIAKQYDVSDSAIRKWCKRMGLPYKNKEIQGISDKEWKKI